MPARIIGGFSSFLKAQLNCNIWDGEVPRYNSAGQAINPTATGRQVQDWPVVTLEMPENGFDRTDTTEDPYDDDGQLDIEVYGTSRAQTEPMLDRIEALLAQASLWPQILTGGPSSNPFYVISCTVRSWFSVQEKGSRTSTGELLYKAGLHYDVRVHGVVSSA